MITTGTKVRIIRQTRADLRKPGSDVPDNRDVLVGQEHVVCEDTAEALLGTKSAILVTKGMAVKPASPPPAPAKVPGRMSRPRD